MPPVEEELQPGTAAAVSEDDEAAFAAGFAEARGEEPPATAAKPAAQEEPIAGEGEQPDPEQAEEQPGQDEQQAEPTDQEQTPDESAVPGLTDEQLTAMLAKLPELEAANRRAFGKIGDLQRVINGLTKSSESGGQPVRLTADQLKRLNKDFPDLAAALAEDLSELGAPGNGSGFDPAAVEPIVQQRVSAETEKISQQMETKLLTVLHRDWPTIVASPEYEVWKQTLPEEDRQQLDNSWDALYLDGKLTEFKTWRERKTNEVQKRQQRLKNAVTPSGNAKGPELISDDDAFVSGFKSVIRGA